jgi:predicted transglutaminase-like cysteine proteinase
MASSVGPPQVVSWLVDIHSMSSFILLLKNVCRSRSVICIAFFRHVRQAAAALGVLMLLSGATTHSIAWDAERLRLVSRQGVAQQESVRVLLDTVVAVSHLDDETRLQTLNLFFNRRVVFREDIEVWGQIDYWATPLEMLSRGEGDCEDYAIAKYFSLVAAGVSPGRMRLVYVKATLAGVSGAVQQAHMVLAYYGGGNTDPLILDNLINEIRPASRRPDLLPVFSFNTEGLWSGTQGPGAGDPASRLSRWRDLLARAKDQGFM